MNHEDAIERILREFGTMRDELPRAVENLAARQVRG